MRKVFTTTQTIKGIQKGSLDTFTMFIEQGYNLLCKNGSFAMIVPIALTSSDSLSGTHRILLNHCDEVRVSSYAVRPKPVFKNAVINTSILIFRKTELPCTSFKATKMNRRGEHFDLQALLDNLEFVDVKPFLLAGRIPKVSTATEKSILNKLLSCQKVRERLQTTGIPIYYRTTGGRYFKVVTNYPTGSTKEKPIYFESSVADAIGCILCSNLSFWFYQIYSNNLDWKRYEIQEFRLPPLNTEVVNGLAKLYKIYEEDIERNANIRLSSGFSRYLVDSFKEYKIVKSKAIIDRIDDLICPLYGLTQEETDFIKNYELEFRMSGDD